MTALLVALLVSLVATLTVIQVAKVHGSRLLDHDLSGPQKFHAHAVPRVGGVGIMVGLMAAIPALLFSQTEAALLGFGLLACGLPAFGAGLLEDFTKGVSPRNRLLATAVSAGLAFLFLQAGITRTDLPGLDWVAGSTAGAAILTIFAVAGIANSVNIIDGFNGLSSMCVVIMLGALSYVGFQVGDTTIGTLALAGMGAVLGFFFWNFPAGLIFLGDGGAYFLGFYVAELSILLLHRNPDVSPMFPLLVCIYPVFETLFSIYRRVMLRDQPAGMPDGIHLHSLIYRRIMRWAIGKRALRSAARRNSMTSPYLWMLCMAAVVPAMLFWNSTPILLCCILVFGLSYTTLYWRIVRFKSPRWLATKR